MYYILILTLFVAYEGGNDGQGAGGIAMAEFASKSACEGAATTWNGAIDPKMSNNRLRRLMYVKNAICVPKGMPLGAT